MAEKKSTILFSSSREAQQKFDYFIAAVTGGIFTYVAQTYKPKRLDFSPESLEPIALIFLAISFFVGLKRIEAMNISMRHNFEALSASEAAGSLTEAINQGMDRGYNPETGEVLTVCDLEHHRAICLQEAEFSADAFEQVSTAGNRYYHIRNYFLYAGFSALFFSKLLSPYFDTATTQTQQTDQPVPVLSQETKKGQESSPSKKE